MKEKVICRNQIQDILKKNKSQMIDLIKGIGFQVKEEYTEKEFSLMIIFVNKTENKNFDKNDFVKLFTESKKSHIPSTEHKKSKKMVM